MLAAHSAGSLIYMRIQWSHNLLTGGWPWWVQSSSVDMSLNEPSLQVSLVTAFCSLAVGLTNSAMPTIFMHSVDIILYMSA